MGVATPTTRREAALHRAPLGFTAIELLVVVAIIGTLVSILVPALQSAREAARRLACSNNFKQITLALHGYHDLHQTFPPGIMYAHSSGETDRRGKRGTGWGWSAMILPFIEHSSLYNTIDFTRPPFDPANTYILQLRNTEVIGTALTVMRCPSDIGPPAASTLAGGGLVDWAVANYAGNAGSFQSSPESDGSIEANGIFGAVRSGRFQAQRSARRIRDIIDGTSHSIILSESAWRRSTTYEGAQVGEVGRKRSYASMDVRFVHGGEWNRILSTGRYRLNPSAQDGVSALRSAASSEHIRGAQFAFADGSVRLLSDHIQHTSRSFSWTDPFDRAHHGKNYGVYQRLWSINDGLPINGL